MDQRPLILFHANCADGFTAAWVAHLKFGDNADYQPVQYGEDPPDVSGRTVYILDFSYKRPVMRQIMSIAHFVIVLDHHKTAEAELAGIVDEFTLRPDLIANPPGSHLPIVWFDMEKSGARLAWEHFFPGKQAPWIVDYTEDRDLWRWRLEYSREVSAAIASYPMTFEQWDWWNRAPSPFDFGLGSEGEAIERYKQQQVDNLCQHAREIELDGHKVLTVNTSLLISEVAGKLAEGRPFGSSWFEREDGKRVWSLRSREEGIDVSEVAQRRGGGGHRNAAGFTE